MVNCRSQILEREFHFSLNLCALFGSLCFYFYYFFLIACWELLIVTQLGYVFWGALRQGSILLSFLERRKSRSAERLDTIHVCPFHLCNA
jgi:hypothetical protein